MPAITSVKPQKNKKRINIYLDGKFGFGIDLETFVKYNLKEGQELSEEAVTKIVKEAEFQKIYDKILRFASLRPRSEKEFHDWLVKHKIHKSIHNDIFNRLKRLDFLNDRKFAVWWIEQRQVFRPKSSRVLRQELIQKGVKKDLIEEVLSEAKIDEVTQAKRILEKRKYFWEKFDGFTARKKMSEYLLRKGFDWDVIEKVIKGVDLGPDSV